MYPEYKFESAIWFVIMLFVNPENIFFQQDDYNPSDGAFSKITRSFILMFFFLALFIIVIQLLNLLVAIMTDNYSTFRQQSLLYKQIEQVQIISKIWHIKWLTPLFNASNIKQQNYIICAFSANTDTEAMGAIQ